MLEADYPELGVVKVASPCSQKWAQMTGDDRVRLCAACKCNVYNFAEISSEEARQLLRRNAVGERICARLYKRIDGTVMTKDCPRGFAHGWRIARKLLPGMTGPRLVLVVMLALVFGTVSLFGDNIRRLFAMTADGGLGPSEPIAPPNPRQHRAMVNFGSNNSY
jgi:hypothetical protein